MVRLLVSVTDASEARDAAAAGADIIDVKDPGAGALGLANPETVRAVRAVTPTGLPVSAALGDGPLAAAAASRAARRLSACGAAYVKLGLRRTSLTAAGVALDAVRTGMPRAVGLIVAGFADYQRADSPDPLGLPDLAETVGASGVLLDTAIKDGRGLLVWLDEGRLRAFVAACRARGLLSGLAGSLGLADLPRVAALGPDIVGVRGAACDGGRLRGRVSGERVVALSRALRSGLGGEAAGAAPLPDPVGGQTTRVP